MDTALSVLIVEDSSSDVGLIVRQLQKDGFAVRHQRIETAQQMREALRDGAWDIVLSDFNVPGFGAAPALTVLHESGLDLPYILVSGLVGEQEAVALMKAGAHDFVMKNQLGRLGVAVRRELAEARERQGRRRAETTLQQRELELEGVLEATADGILAVNSAGKVIQSNRRFAELWRIPKAVLDRSEDQILLDFVLDQLSDPQKFLEQVNALHGSTTDYNDTLHFKDGRVFERHSSALVSGGEVVGRVWCFRDVTERTLHERTLQESERRFRGLIEQSLTGIYITRDGVYLYANPRLEQMLGYAAGQLVGMRAEDLVVAQDLPIMRAERDKLRAGAMSSSYSLRAQRRDGGIIELGVQGRVFESDGLLCTVGMAQDITEKKRAEEEIQRYVAQLKAAFISTVELATTLSEMRDPYTAGHERRVGKLAAAIGAELGWEESRIEGLRVAGYLHDIGKISIPAEMLSKPGKLGAIELMLIQSHAQASYEVLKDVAFPWPVAKVALQHHERIDGSGYPQGLKGEAILFEARIIAVADVIEAMSSHRPYRAALGLEAALGEVERGSGTHYDPMVVAASLRLFREKAYAIPA